MICYHLYYILFELQYMIAAVYGYFSLFHSLCLLLLSVLFSVCYFFSFFVDRIFLRSKIFTTVLLIIGRQLVELCVFLVACHCMIYICNLT